MGKPKNRQAESNEPPGRNGSVEIRGVDSKYGPGQVAGGSFPKTPASADGASNVTSAEGDQVEISALARCLDAYKNLPAVRQDKVDAARQAIQAGTADSPEKLSVALDRLLEDVLSG